MTSPHLAEYEAGNLDRTDAVPLADLDRIKADPMLSQEYSIVAGTVHVLLRVQHQGPDRR